MKFQNARNCSIKVGAFAPFTVGLLDYRTFWWHVEANFARRARSKLSEERTV